MTPDLTSIESESDASGKQRKSTKKNDRDAARQKVLRCLTLGEWQTADDEEARPFEELCAAYTSFQQRTIGGQLARGALQYRVLAIAVHLLAKNEDILQQRQSERPDLHDSFNITKWEVLQQRYKTYQGPLRILYNIGRDWETWCAQFGAGILLAPATLRAKE